MSFKLIRQKDSMQCGIAALAMVCNYYGTGYSLLFLESYCHPTADGVSMKGLNDTALRLGLRSAVVRIAIDRFAECPLPVIVHWNQNHFVVLYKIKNGRYYIADPSKGKIKYSKEEFESHWASIRSNGCLSGIVMVVQPTDDFGKIAEEVRSVKLKSVITRHFSGFKRQLAVIILGMFIGNAFQLLLPFLTQQIVDRGIHNKDIGIIWLILLGELMIIIGQTVANFVRRRFLLNISMKVNIRLVSEFFIKLLKLPMSFFDTKLTGDLMQRMGDHSRVQTFLTSQVLSLVFSILSFIVFGVILLLYSHTVFLIFIIGSIVYGLWIILYLNKRKIIDYDLFEQQAKNQQNVFRFLTSVQEIKLQGCEERRRQEWENTQNELFNVEMRSLKLQQNQEAGSIFINEMKNILITVFAATAVIYGQLSLGAMLAIQYIVGQLNYPVEQLMSFIYSLQDVRISMERINEIYSRKDEERTGGLTAFNNSVSLNIENISFRYDPHSMDNTIENVSALIKPGETTAIVGTSGSGKTTLLKLILGYYKPMEGKIMLSGVPLDNYCLRWWREQCGVVMQDSIIFSESIKRNIAVKDGEIDENRVIEAAKLANIHDFINSLPIGYDTKIGPDGLCLSQGQKQRILIARAIYINPPFVIFDEATNSLDTENEKIIVENLNEFFRNRTVIVVAHRLSTVKNADHIIVISGGTIVETGDHLSLINKKGAYYNLVKNQI